MLYGEVKQDHFDEVYLTNQELLDIVAKVKVSVSEEANRRAPEAMLCRVDVVTRSGQMYSSEVAYHKGHYKDPLDDSEVEAKFRSLCDGRLSNARTSALLERLWNLDKVEEMEEILRVAKI